MLSVIIPAYNEEKCIRRVYDAIHSLLSENNIESEFIFIDDGSKDETYKEISELSMEKENITGLHFSRNFGKESAISADLKKFEVRAISEPPTGLTIKGPRNGFNESIKSNLSLIRRYIKSPDLKVENFQKDATYKKIKLSQSGDDASKTELIKENMGLVFSVAKRFYNRGYDADDINQLGTIGLLRAIERFDVTQNVSFSTYAVPLILGEIKCFLRDDGPVKVSRSIKQTATQITHFIETHQKTYGFTPGIEEIKNALGIEIEEILKGFKF